MPNKKVILAALAAALLFGAAISGCNRQRDARSASRDQRHGQPKSRRDAGAGSYHRPAEVLSASARRVSPPRQSPEYYAQPVAGSYQATSAGMVRVYEPLPEPIPVEHLPRYRQQPAQYAGQPYSDGAYYADAGQYHAQGGSYQVQPHQPVGYVQGPYDAPMEVIHPSPELAMARVQLQSPAVVPAYAQPAQYVIPAPAVQARSAPIPELEPVRYQRVAFRQQAVAAPPPLRSAGSMGAVSAPPGQYDTPGVLGDVQRALAPLARTETATGPEWVSSPATAMWVGYR